MKKNVIFVLAVMAILLLAAGNGMAGMSNDTLDLSITLVSGCTVSTSGSVDLGTFNVGDPDQYGLSVGDVVITCDVGTPYDWGADIGLNPDQSLMYPNLINENLDLLPYRLTLTGGVNDLGDAGLSQIDPSYVETWGALSWVSQGGSGVSNGTDTFPLMADVLVYQAIATGTYTDTVTVTVVW